MALSGCLAAGFAFASLSGALAGSATDERSGASALRGLVDLSHPFNERTIYWPTARQFRLIEVADGETEGGYHYSATTSPPAATPRTRSRCGGWSATPSWSTCRARRSRTATT